MSWKLDPPAGLVVTLTGVRVEVADVLEGHRGPVVLVLLNGRREWMTLSEWRRWWSPCKGDPPRAPRDDSDDGDDNDHDDGPADPHG